MKAIVFDRIGLPLDVLQIKDLPIPELKKGHVLIKMISASINPGDFLFIQNLYPDPKKPKFPDQIAGNHGAGIVIDSNGCGIANGSLVAFSFYNTWAEYALVPEEWLIVLPSHYPAEKAGQFVNFISAYELVLASKVLPEQWLVLTAGHSSISIIAAQFAKSKGIKVVSIVRKRQTDIDLTTMGSEAVVDLSEVTDIKAAIKEITNGSGVHGFVDNVGGPTTGDIIRSMAFGGQVVINGGMSEEQYLLHNFDVLLNGLEIRSYVYRYFFEPPIVTDKPMLQEIIEHTISPFFKVPVAQLHKLEDYYNAIVQTINNPARGKHLFAL